MKITKLQLAGALLAGASFPWLIIFGSILRDGYIWGIEPNPYALWVEMVLPTLSGIYGVYLVLRRS